MYEGDQFGRPNARAKRAPEPHVTSLYPPISLAVPEAI
jgi:hypothetical protein